MPLRASHRRSVHHLFTYPTRMWPGSRPLHSSDIEVVEKSVVLMATADRFFVLISVSRPLTSFLSTAQVKIVMNYIQTTSLARELRVQFDEMMSYLLEAEEAIGGAGFWRMTAFNCQGEE